MQLLKMELRGFKSFADKTILLFDKGITAIVGPNGSGKSNISDAVRWVLGEQNVRHLRGQRAEDIIFSGTDTRRPQGAAEVSLYFDNSDRTLDTDYTEVVVTRRYFRSGDSEFYINKRPCRLKDIHTLFADTGIGRDSMALIGQNRVDRILNSKPEERRIIFEEVAGISRFKSRKEEGLKKLKETENNLARIRDLTNLLEERLQPAAEQAEKLRTFRGLDRERQSYEGTLALQELRNFERLLVKAENTAQQARRELAEINEAIGKIDKKRLEILSFMEKEGAAGRLLNETAGAIRSEAESMKTRLEAIELRREELKQTLNVLAAEEPKAVQKREAVTAKTADLERRLAACRKEKETVHDSLALAERVRREVREKTAALKTRLYERTQAADLRKERVYVLTRDIEVLKQRLEENDKRRNSSIAAIEAATEKVRALRQSLTAETMSLSVLRGEKAAHIKTCEEEQYRLKTARAALAEYEEQRRKTDAYLAGLQQRLRVLEGLIGEYEGLGKAVKTVLKAEESWHNDICGLVGDICGVPAEYATAVDVALGAASRYIVLRTEGAAKEAIAYLRRKNAGRVTFLPLDTVRSRRRGKDEEEALREDGIIGTAKDLITYDETYEVIFSSLLEKTLVASTAGAASAAARKFGNRLRIVCLDGTVFNAGGSLTGGSVQQKESSLIGRRTLSAALRSEAAAAEKKRENLGAALNRLQQDEVAAAASLKKRQHAAAECAEKLHRCEWKCARDEEDLKEAENSLAALKRESDELHKLQEEMTCVLAEKRNVLAGLQKGEDDSGLTELEAELARSRAEAEQYDTALTERKIALTKIEEEERHFTAQLEQQIEWLNEQKREGENLKGRLTEARHKLAETEALIVTTGETLSRKEAEARHKEEKKEAFYRSREKNFKAHRELEDELRRRREDAEGRQKRMTAADVQIEKYRGEIARSEEKLAAQGLTRKEAMERRRGGSLKELQEKVASLRVEIAGLGTVNPNAEAEYAEIEEKTALYRKQSDDLLASRSKLEGVIKEIDRAMERQFNSAFRDIGVHFQQVFGRLFGGGTAKLLLTDTERVLDSGVDFLIRPPGKKQQPLTLFSGGERALTVIALLLAFLAYHPAPFCLVDEVDAALDEANVDRMAKYLKNYSGDTQFIVITHRRKSMEAANTLQGVTMEEKGVSRLLTVQVDSLIEEA
ncbi:chromosome segregation protein SMC [Megasphaera coli]|uniref:chromosome segregation protein SMC n=2 Tax=Colibacter massiliensis TaxID=1852379 RepID=UPI00094E4B3E|nr:chromosome segregation protein SMC [Colibacter massiliensis]